MKNKLNLLFPKPIRTLSIVLLSAFSAIYLITGESFINLIEGIVLLFLILIVPLDIIVVLMIKFLSKPPSNPPELPRCPKCGTGYKPWDYYCGNCGYQIREKPMTEEEKQKALQYGAECVAYLEHQDEMEKYKDILNDI